MKAMLYAVVEPTVVGAHMFEHWGVLDWFFNGMGVIAAIVAIPVAIILRRMNKQAVEEAGLDWNNLD